MSEDRDAHNARNIPSLIVSEQLKSAVAIAIAESRREKRKDCIDWKAKALVARSTLMKISKCMKKYPGVGYDTVRSLLDQMNDIAQPVPSIVSPRNLSTQLTRHEASARVIQRSIHLSEFIEAVEVCMHFNFVAISTSRREIWYLAYLHHLWKSDDK
jgi:hypothetical protein